MCGEQMGALSSPIGFGVDPHQAHDMVFVDRGGEPIARGIDRREIAPRTMFMSHETYTPARGGSASAEISALRRVFGEYRAPTGVAARSAASTASTCSGFSAMYFSTPT